MNYITIEDLISEGYLQEANRQFFHPLGLALEADFYGVLHVQDHRDDPDGVVFAEDLLDEAFTLKAMTVASQWAQFADRRRTHLGWITQPLPAETVDKVET